MARALIVTLVASAMPVTAHAISTWNPTLLVNTESFQEVDAGDGTTSVDLRFGATTSTLKLLTNGKFQFSKSLSVLGGISGSYLTIDHQANISGALMVDETITARSTVSGANLTFMGVSNSYVLGRLGVGTASPATRLDVLDPGTHTIVRIQNMRSTGDAYSMLALNAQGGTDWRIGTANATETALGLPSKFYLYNATSAFTAFAVTPTGDMGIGTAAPELKLEVIGTISGSRLSVISNQVTSTGALFVHQKAVATGALIKNSAIGLRPVLALDGRGSTGTAAHIVFGYKGTFDTKLFRKSPGVLQTDGNFVVQQTISGSSFIGAGLGDCNNATNSKLIYNATTGKFSCATDQTGGGTTGGTGSAWSNTGALRAAFDDRYVNQSGDTMTGILRLTKQGGSYTGALLNALGGLSGYFLRTSGNADIHGPLAVSGALRGDGDFTINDDRTTSADAILTFGNSTANQTLKFVHSMQKFEFSASLRVLGTISGSILRVDGNADVNGRLSLSGATLMRAISDPSAPGASRLATYASDLGGRVLLEGRSPSGGGYAYQPALFQNFVMMLEAGGGTTINGIGTTVTNDTTISHPTPTETFGYMANFATSTTTNDTAGTSSVNTTFIRGSAAGANGFFYRARIGVVDTTSIRTFSGLANQTIATMVGADNPVGHYVGFQFSTNRPDTNWQFTTKDNTTQSVADTGIAFTASKVYDLTFYCTQQCTSITWRIDNVTDGTNATGTASSNLPGTTTAMRIVNGVSTLTTAAKNLRMQFTYVEADR